MTMKKILGFVAMVLAIAACNTMEMDNHPTGKDGMITITAQLAPKTPITKAVADNGDNKITATWAVGEHLALHYKKDGTYSVNAEITHVDGNGTATISFEVKSNLTDGTTCTIIYPYSGKNLYDYSNSKVTADLLEKQKGVLDTLLDFRIGEGIFHTSTSSLEVTTQPTPLLSIFKFMIQDLAGTAKDVSKFQVGDSGGNVLASVEPETATSEMYVVLPVLEAGTCWFSATINGQPYVAKATASATEAGKYYQSTVKMATIGNVIANNGKFYINNDATPPGDSAVAMISYLGSNTNEKKPYVHGLAVAMRNAGLGGEMKWKTENTKSDHTNCNYYNNSFTNESGLQYNATHNNDTYPAFQAAMANNGTPKPGQDYSDWFLPSGNQWNLMIKACKDLSNKGLFNSFESRGGTNMFLDYWSCSESSTDISSAYYFSTSSTWSGGNKTSIKKVRSALAF